MNVVMAWCSLDALESGLVFSIREVEVCTAKSARWINE